MTHNTTDWLSDSPQRSERRRRRSSNPHEALGLWLESRREQGRLRNLVLANDLGVVVSGAGAADEWEELAAWAPILLEQGAADRALSSVKLPGYPAFVCSEASAAAPALLDEVATGCARILDASLG